MNDTSRVRAIAESVSHIETILQVTIPDADLLVIEEAIGLAYDTGEDDAISNIRLFSTHDIANELSVTRAWVWQMAQRDELGRRVGRDLVFTEIDVETMRGRKTLPGPAAAQLLS